MSIKVTWQKYDRVSDELRLLRDMFSYLGVNLEWADNAALLSMVERYKKNCLEEAQRASLAESAVAG